MSLKSRIAAATGKYTGQDGKEKTRRATVGQLHGGQYGDYVTLDPLALVGVCLAAITRGEDRVMCALYEPDPQSGPKASAAKTPGPDLNDDLPF